MPNDVPDGATKIPLCELQEYGIDDSTMLQQASVRPAIFLQTTDSGKCTAYVHLTLSGTKRKFRNHSTNAMTVLQTLLTCTIKYLNSDDAQAHVDSKSPDDGIWIVKPARQVPELPHDVKKLSLADAGTKYGTDQEVIQKLEKYKPRLYLQAPETTTYWAYFCFVWEGHHVKHKSFGRDPKILINVLLRGAFEFVNDKDAQQKMLALREKSKNPTPFPILTERRKRAIANPFRFKPHGLSSHYRASASKR